MNQGTVAFGLVGLMIAMLMLITAIVFIEPLKEIAGVTKTEMNCDWTNLSTGEEMTCIIIDITPPGYIAIALITALSFIGIRTLVTRTPEQ
jgi:hypothetical protein